MGRIVVIPWLQGSRPCWQGSYTPARIQFTIDHLVKAAPDLPVYVACPHPETRFQHAKTIDATDVVRKNHLAGSGVTITAFHPDLAEFDIDLVTADTLILRDPREAMPSGDWWCPQQHWPEGRPYGDWFCHMPKGNQIRTWVYKAGIKRRRLHSGFDKLVLATARRSEIEPRLIKPPVILNGEWIIEGWEPWCQPLTDKTVAVHPHSHTKWPELADKHPYFEHLRDVFATPVTDEQRDIQRESHEGLGVPSHLTT